MLNYRRVYLDLEILGTSWNLCNWVQENNYGTAFAPGSSRRKTGKIPFRLAVGPGMPWSLTDWIISEAVATYS